MNNYAIVLAGGSGSRMSGDIPKQYMLIHNRPVICHSLLAFENNPNIQGIVVVTRSQDIDYVQKEIVETYNISKVKAVVVGGSERFESVYNGLLAMEAVDYVFIHDAARPCVNDNIIANLMDAVQRYGNAVSAVKSKDTIKVTDEAGFVVDTPVRANTWIVQTPQVFSHAKITVAFRKYFADANRQMVTDDAMLMEKYSDEKVYLCPGEYTNIKITTDEDLTTVSAYLKKE